MQAQEVKKKSQALEEGRFRKADMLPFELKVLSLYYGIVFGLRTILAERKNVLKNDILVHSQGNTFGNLAIK